ncbi:MAG: hypothetical protein DMD81_08100 [Candidatus Rokuibacteriota bacterium]|nr:MAG: hypothetical protein DMD81_08100 [Candidatus Rokubacteria bacterium]
MGTDRFGNSFAPSLPYARGTILASTADDYRKLERAYALIRQHGAEHVFVFTGLEHALPMEPEDLKFADDELAPALWGDRLRTLALGHLGGSPERHDVVVTNRLTGATLATFLTLVKPGDTVIGVSASFSHPSVQRAAAHTGARFVDTAGLDQFTRALEGETRPTLVALTRLAVTYELLPADAVSTIVKLAHDRGATVYVDDAGGARVISAAPAWTSTARSGRASGFSPARKSWSGRFARRSSSSGSRRVRCATPRSCARSSATTRGACRSWSRRRSRWPRSCGSVSGRSSTRRRRPRRSWPTTCSRSR